MVCRCVGVDGLRDLRHDALSLAAATGVRSSYYRASKNPHRLRFGRCHRVRARHGVIVALASFTQNANSAADALLADYLVAGSRGLVPRLHPFA